MIVSNPVQADLSIVFQVTKLIIFQARLFNDHVWLGGAGDYS